MNWKALVYADQTKTHFVAPSLVEAVVADIANRYGVTPGVISDEDALTLDPGGMCFTNSNWESEEFAGLTVKIRAEHILGMILSGGLSRRDMDNGMTKVYFNYVCAVLPTDAADAIDAWLLTLDDGGDRQDLVNKVAGHVITE
tara:strand:+ start:71 stop:499 length:429 start_codon:yes stop_codon:yes gene_type:complete